MTMRVVYLLLPLAIALAGCAGLDEALDPANTNLPGTGASLDKLDMDEAEITHQDATSIVFTWEDKAPPTGDGPVTSTFTVPDDAPFQATATLTWDDQANLRATLDAENVAQLCSASDAEQAECAVPSLAQDPGTHWTAIVERADEQGPTDDEQDPIPFTLELTIELLDPETTPETPTLVPQGESAPLDPGWPDRDDATIRPGDKIAGGVCTGNFIFSTPDNSTLYMGTAAHCLPGTDLGQEVPIANGEATGRVAYCSWGASENLLTCVSKGGSDDGWQDDFALVEIPEDQREKVHPAMLVWGGPTELGQAPAQGTEVYTYGNSGIRDGGEDMNVLDPRKGIVTGSSESTTHAYFTGPSIWGDSGSPVVTEDGATVGTMQTLGILPPGVNGVSNLDYSLQHFQANTDRQIELATWDTFTPPEVTTAQSLSGS